MNAQFDEAKLTAYALGELDETDRADVERLLEESPDAARRWNPSAAWRAC